MPMGGKELDKACGTCAPLPLLFMSGYPGQDVADRGLLDPTASFLQKPFSPEELAQRVRGCWTVGRRRPGTEEGDSGQGGIRTHDTLAGIPVFETGSFSHSDTCPWEAAR
jgi:DNA-binding response OmpR family regulator